MDAKKPMDLQIGKPVVVESLQIQLVRAGELRFEGTLATNSARIELSRRLQDVHTSIVRDGIRSFTVDVRSLKFVDSSAIRLFVDWIARAESSKYRLVFITDQAMTWQRLSFAVLKSLGPNSVEVQEMDKESPPPGPST
jgi:hypothetical protein